MNPLVGAVCRAKLVTTADGREELSFHYNPETLQVVKTADWHKPRVPAKDNIAEPEFVGCTGRTLNLTLLLDGVDSRGNDVAADVETLLRWTRATPESHRRYTPQPPLMRLHWGGHQYFPGYLSRVDVTYTVFSPDGAPLRAKVVIAMEEVPEPAKRQNPTSGGVPDRRAVTLRGGDSLASLASAEYGDPNLWRALALANGIDDPARVSAGTPLVVPPLAEARELAGVRRA